MCWVSAPNARVQARGWVVGLDYFRDQNQLGAADNPFYRQNPN